MSKAELIYVLLKSTNNRLISYQEFINTAVLSPKVVIF